MALDSRQKRAAVIGVGRAWYRNPHPSSVNAAQRASIAQVYPVAAFQGVTAPVFSGTIADISVDAGSGTHQYDYSTYFSNSPTSYSISPAVEDGWTFNTSTGVLTIDTDASNTFGPYTITGTNAGGSDSSNAFSVTVSSAYSGGYFYDFEAVRDRSRRKFKAKDEDEKQAKPIIEDIAEQLAETAVTETAQDIELILRMRLRQQQLKYKSIYLKWLKKQAEIKKYEIKQEVKRAAKRKRRKQEEELVIMLLH